MLFTYKHIKIMLGYVAKSVLIWSKDVFSNGYLNNHKNRLFLVILFILSLELKYISEKITQSKI